MSCLVAAGVLASGAMGFAVVQQKQATPETELVAMEREVPRAASRGSERSENALAADVAASAQRSEFGSPADQPDATTTTTSTSTTTSTTAAPKPEPKPAEKKAESEPKPAEKPAPKPAPKPATNDTGVVGDDVWTKLAACESGNRNYTAGPFYGYFQFLPSTWRAMGGTGLPSDHPYETQKAMAQKLQQRSGWGQWPACSRKLGLR